MLTIPLLEDPVSNYPPIYDQVFQVVTFPQVSHPPTKTLYALLLSPIRATCQYGSYWFSLCRRFHSSVITSLLGLSNILYYFI